MNELAGQSLGGYELEQEIGRGSMGMVYRGKQIALGREVAVKVLPQGLARDASYVARFIREAQIMAGLNYPSIVHIFDAGQQSGLLYFVMEYVQGPTLASLLRLDGVLPQHIAIEYAAQIADALDYAYRERHVIHRDIKPENLMLDHQGKIKVMDFGLARAPGVQRITLTKALVGSIYYASPEQIWGQTLDNRSDIYALGVVLYEMVTGQRPFHGRSLPDLTQAITVGPVLPPRLLNHELHAGLERIILTAMARDRNQRYMDAKLLAQELRSLLLRPTASRSQTPSRLADAPKQWLHDPWQRPQAPTSPQPELETQPQPVLFPSSLSAASRSHTGNPPPHAQAQQLEAGRPTNFEEQNNNSRHMRTENRPPRKILWRKLFKAPQK